jgi:hypothetical protein
MGKAKLAELQNNLGQNQKYLHDEELLKRTHAKDYKRFNEELDNIAQMTDEAIKLKIREHVQNDIAMIQNTIQNNQLKLNILLSKYKEDQQNARDLLDHKIALSHKQQLLKYDIDNQEKQEKDNKYQYIDLKTEIQEMQLQFEENKIFCETIMKENDNLRKNNAKLDHDTLALQYKLDEIKQKMELNDILKDVDVEELKLLSQNNAMVNSTISNLIYKWDNAYNKLVDMEKSKADGEY